MSENPFINNMTNLFEDWMK